MRTGYFCFTAEYSGARKEREKEYEERSISRDASSVYRLYKFQLDASKI